MDTGTLMKIAICGTVLLLFVSAVAVPLLNGVTYTKTAHNDPTGYATKTIPSGVYRFSDNGFTIDNDNETAVEVYDWIFMSDSLLIHRTWNNIRSIDLVGGSTYYGAITIDGAAGTWSHGSTTGSLGDGIVKANSGELATFYNKEFTINRTGSAMEYLEAVTVSVTGTNETGCAIISGPIDDLTVTALTVFSNTNTYNPENFDNITVNIDDAIIDEDYRTITIGANPQIDATFTYNNQEYTITTTPTSPSSIVAPLDYITTVDNGTITTMIGIVPLIMIVGVITMIIGFVITRH